MKKLLPVQFVFLFIIVQSAIAFGQTNYYTIKDTTIPVHNAAISATLFTPGIKKPPVVLIIAGSGPTDRNGNSPLLPGKNNSLLQLADSLAKNGIASLRFDKRAIGKSKLAKGITEDSVRFTDMIDDAEQLYNYLQREGYKKIFIAGHSEGSLIGMALAQRVKAAGYISISGSGRKAADILKEQLSSLPGNLKEESYVALDSLQAGHLVKKFSPQLFSILRPSVQPYMISWLELDPAKIIGSLSCDVLILQGDNDLQVLEKDALALKQANNKATLVIVKNMNHVLKEVLSKDATENKKAYSNPDLQVMPELVAAMVHFIKKKN